MELVVNKPNAFLLLTMIAWRAKRTNSFSAYGLEMGQALIGDYENYGLTRQTYRTSVEFLRDNGFITTKSTNKGTIATISDTRIYDINSQEENQQTNQTVTNEQPTGNQRATTNKNERKKECKNINPMEGELPLNGEKPEEVTILEHLNLIAGKHYKPLQTSLSPIRARLREVKDVEGIKKMITRQVNKWKGTQYEEYLSPSTLFGPEKFPRYYESRDLPILDNTNNNEMPRMVIDHSKGF